jgi:GNAT superfamily N-acetyltransferase
MYSQFENIELRSYEASDRAAVFELLQFLPVLYPNGDAWLDKRLGEILNGRGRCTLARRPGQIVGITIETPKNLKSIKLSTIFVHHDFRARGIGTSLLASRVSEWRRESARQCYVTADFRIAEQLRSFLGRFSFEERAFLRNRYGEGRHEVVFCWTSERDQQHLRSD